MIHPLLIAVGIGIFVAAASKKPRGATRPTMPGAPPRPSGPVEPPALDACIPPTAGIIAAITNTSPMSPAEKVSFFDDLDFPRAAAVAGGTDSAALQAALTEDIRTGHPDDLDDFGALLEEAAPASDYPMEAVLQASACLHTVAASRRAAGFGGGRHAFGHYAHYGYPA